MNERLKELIVTAKQQFEQQWNQPAIHCAYGPGRVNLIGDHVDYNDGFVFPMAIPEMTVVVGAESNTDECTIRTLQPEFANNSLVTFKIDSLEPGQPNWANYVKGVVAHFPNKTKPFNAVIATSVPVGSGLSSSAALEIATFLFLESLNGPTGLKNSDKARICQRAEHTYAGMPCGIMDQLICISGKANHAVLIDCRSLDTELVPINSAQFTFIVTNSNVKHELATSEYAIRRKACETVASLLGKTSLRDVSMRELETSRAVLSEELYCTARHVITEIERTVDAAEALKRDDLKVFGTLMSQSHVSLRDDYRVSCTEVDQIVEIALSTEGVLGSRITGGGFGGCVVSLIHKDAVEAFQDALSAKYSGNAVNYNFIPGNGAEIVDLTKL